MFYQMYALSWVLSNLWNTCHSVVVSCLCLLEEYLLRTRSTMTHLEWRLLKIRVSLVWLTCCWLSEMGHVIFNTGWTTTLQGTLSCHCCCKQRDIYMVLGFLYLLTFIWGCLLALLLPWLPIFSFSIVPYSFLNGCWPYFFYSELIMSILNLSLLYCINMKPKGCLDVLAFFRFKVYLPPLMYLKPVCLFI